MASHSVTLPSSCPVPMVNPSGDHARLKTLLSLGGKVSSISPVVVSHTTVPHSFASVTICSPEGDHARSSITGTLSGQRAACGLLDSNSRPVATSHIMAGLGSATPPAATRWPSGDHAGNCDPVRERFAPVQDLNGAILVDRAGQGHLLPVAYRGSFPVSPMPAARHALGWCLPTLSLPPPP